MKSRSRRVVRSAAYEPFHLGKRPQKASAIVLNPDR